MRNYWEDAVMRSFKNAFGLTVQGARSPQVWYRGYLAVTWIGSPLNICLPRQLGWIDQVE